MPLMHVKLPGLKGRCPRRVSDARHSLAFEAAQSPAPAISMTAYDHRQGFRKQTGSRGGRGVLEQSRVALARHNLPRRKDWLGGCEVQSLVPRR